MFVPLPRGMSDGFYKFMGAGARRTPSGETLMFIQDKESDRGKGQKEAEGVREIRQFDEEAGQGSERGS